MRRAFLRTAFAFGGLAIGLCPIKQASGSMIASLAFTTPTGTVNNTDSIPVFLTLTLNPTSDPFITDNTGIVISGVTTAEVEANFFSALPAGVNLATDPLTSVVGGFNGCSIAASCFLSSYNFLYTLSFNNNLDVEPGKSMDFQFGALVPVGGAAPPGSYNLSAGLVIQVFDGAFPSDPNFPNPFGLNIADIALSTLDTGSVFTRDVMASAPEPATGTLLLGFTLVGVLSPQARTAGFRG